jgi:sugar phosphate isomerase/epimerase
MLDPARTLSGVAKAGYRQVELLSFDDGKPSAIHAALKASGLRARSVHAVHDRPDGPDLGAGLGKLIDYSHAVGANYVVASVYEVPARLETREENVQAYLTRVAYQMTADDWKVYGDTLNKKGAVLARHGLKLAHHNHHFEFVRLAGGGTGFDTLVRATDPNLVTFQLDTGWAEAFGQDSRQLLRKHGGRVALAHIKPSTSGGVCDDPLAWEAFSGAACKAGVTNLYTGVSGVIHA